MLHPSILLYLSIFCFSLLTSYCLFLGALFCFPKLGLVDNPLPYGHARNAVPLGTGIVLYGNFAIVCAILLTLGILDPTEKLFILLGLGAIITGVSFFDDLDTIFKFDRTSNASTRTSSEELTQVRKTKFAISPKVRLIIQIFIGLIVGLTSIKISYVSNLFGGILYLDAYSFSLWNTQIFIIPIIFTIFWYVLVFNSINWSDGVPGLTVWLTTIALIIIAISTVRFYLVDETPALRQNSVFVFGVLAVLLPSLLVAWWYNIAPKMLIGDSGTVFIAFMIASLAILVWGKVATVATALWVYLVDAIYVIMARILNKKNPLKGDRIHHLHYRLKAIGMTDSFIRRLVYSMSFIFGISAVFLDKVGKIILFVALVLVIVFITKILSLKK